jgi:hypothetical protein
MVVVELAVMSIAVVILLAALGERFRSEQRS